ncbi:MAG: hypothetical protein E1N59_1379 [Puniceicoccaceae bacterium 5H]|nr:MAG: hypothetical protein E1N59_1379 [Puniceicoccaceae bacterium 5H]
MSVPEKQPLDSAQARDPASLPQEEQDENTLPPTTDEQLVRENMVDAGVEAASDEQAENAQDEAQDDEPTDR